jgi:ATP-binding cassette subfamily B protein
VRANIGLGAPEHLGDQAALERAASRAGADAVIAGLPDGWDTVLDRQFDGGTDLSGGQWQRLALARALFAVESGARVLVLDEPTAALDVRAEADVYDRFLDITTGLTSIVISHRFSTVRRADRIVVIDGGRVIEDGDHASLLVAGGRYARMFELQAARYRADPTGDGDTGLPDGETEGVLA